MDFHHQIPDFHHKSDDNNHDNIEESEKLLASDENTSWGSEINEIEIECDFDIGDRYQPLSSYLS